MIVLPHWGIEYAAKSEDIQRVWAQEFINAGASLVIGNHPHIIQPMEIFSDKLIFYALGNFVFDQEHNFQRESIVVEVNFIGAEIESWKSTPRKYQLLYITTPLGRGRGSRGDILARAKAK